MDGKRFDDFSRLLATPRTRRGMLGMLGAAVAGLVTGSSGTAAPPPDKPKKCYGGGSHCTNGKQCCSGICTNRQCAPEIPPECVTASDCPGSDTECQARACVSGQCRMNFSAAGTPIAAQTAGDCQMVVCDGNGGTTSVADDTDLPNDGNPCTDDACQNGSPVFANSAAGTACGDGRVCTGDGACGECGPGETISCYTGPAGTANVGVCRTGTRTCQANGTFGPCVGEALPGSEVCNGLDDDCDGLIDVGVEREGDACQTGGLGICAEGTLQCHDGALSCVQTHQPRPETCNGLDDNCNGQVDDNPAGIGMPCLTNAPGVCASGSTQCVNGELVCISTVTPSPETCNGLDDDCDGLIDEGAICPPVANGTSICRNGQCVVDTCNAGWQNCDGNPANGCETNLTNNVQHCGQCNRVCLGASNASPACVNGTCAIVCHAGFFDCNGFAGDGCECRSDRVCDGGQCCSVSGQSPIAGAPCCPGTVNVGGTCIGQ